MAKIYKYQKITDQHTTYNVVEPDYREGDERIVDLATIDGYAYICVPDSITLPDQPPQVDLQEIVVDAALYEAIEQRSAHVRLVRQRLADGTITKAQAIAAKRALGYIPAGLMTTEEKQEDARLEIEGSILYDKTNAQINNYIDTKVVDLPSARDAIELLAIELRNVIRRQGWED